jgi:hypothetical protein
MDTEHLLYELAGVRPGQVQPEDTGAVVNHRAVLPGVPGKRPSDSVTMICDQTAPSRSPTDLSRRNTRPADTPPGGCDGTAHER